MSKMLKAEDVAAALKVGESKAYQLIRIMNAELQQQGYLTVRGRISAEYFQRRFFGGQKE